MIKYLNLSFGLAVGMIPPSFGSTKDSYGCHIDKKRSDWGWKELGS